MRDNKTSQNLVQLAFRYETVRSMALSIILIAMETLF